jgi:streptomycin 6-kinase
MRARYNLVVEAAANDGRRLVLRATSDPAAHDQYLVSTALAKLGIGPTIHEYLETGDITWTVAERITPGTRFADMEWSDVDPDALGTTLRALVDQPAPSSTMPSVYDWLEARLIAGDGLTDLAPGTRPAPAEERRRALGILRELGATRTDGLCHGDASPPNLLTGNSGRFFVIDPRGVSGEAEYDVAVVALKVERSMPNIDALSILARLAGVDHERTQAWRAVASAARV